MKQISCFWWYRLILSFNKRAKMYSQVSLFCTENCQDVKTLSQIFSGLTLFLSNYCFSFVSICLRINSISAGKICLDLLELLLLLELATLNNWCVIIFLMPILLPLPLLQLKSCLIMLPIIDSRFTILYTRQATLE